MRRSGHGDILDIEPRGGHARGERGAADPVRPAGRSAELDVALGDVEGPVQGQGEIVGVGLGRGAEPGIGARRCRQPVHVPTRSRGPTPSWPSYGGGGAG